MQIGIQMYILRILYVLVSFVKINFLQVIQKNNYKLIILSIQEGALVLVTRIDSQSFFSE